MDFIEILLDSVLDCIKLVPFLLITILFMEYLEHRASHKFEAALAKAGKFGPVAGAALGCVPQCGFSAACSQLFNGGLISAGTLVAVFISTSDEAIPILIASPNQWNTVGLIILIKVFVAILTGMILDRLWKPENQHAEFSATTQPHRCNCHSDGKWTSIIWAAVKRTLSILLFLFISALILNIGMELIGKERIAAILLPGFFQPFLAAIIGLIPNCAASVFLTQLYLEGLISFGSVIAGLSTAMGIGLLVLLRGKRSKKTIAIVLGTVFASSVFFGLLIQLLS